jgi:hypothetical protein
MAEQQERRKEEGREMGSERRTMTRPPHYERAGFGCQH